MPKFTKKPVTIEAMQFDGTVESADAIREWATMPDGMSAECARDSHKGACTYLGIRTLEGTMRANSGDWIIKGVKGEFYPCKPDIFAATYEDAAIALMRGQSWQPIETAPKDGSPILIFHPEGGVCEGFCPGEGFGWHVMDGTNTYIGQKSGKSLPSLTTYMTPPTHWQPLPSPPKDSADEQ